MLFKHLVQVRSIDRSAEPHRKEVPISLPHEDPISTADRIAKVSDHLRGRATAEVPLVSGDRDQRRKVHSPLVCVQPGVSLHVEVPERLLVAQESVREQ